MTLGQIYLATYMAALLGASPEESLWFARSRAERCCDRMVQDILRGGSIDGLNKLARDLDSACIEKRGEINSEDPESEQLSFLRYQLRIWEAARSGVRGAMDRLQSALDSGASFRISR